MSYKKLLTGIALLSMSSPLIADEGMWQPHQLPQLADTLKQKGLEIDPAKLSSLTEFPMNAVISLGGCTASFVSPKGLVVTNHHCAYGSIQFNSTPDNNLLENGFLAKSLDKELPAAPGSRVYVTENVSDVTEQVLGDLDASLSGAERYKAIETKRKALIAECEADAGYRCQVSSFHHGKEYFLTKRLEIRDVRLVHAPALSVGKYGGDIDNWMWPRHTGDYSFYRAYVGKDGKPADYSKDNVPFTPPSYLKVSAKGLDEGDFVMVAGYPGRTNRYRTASEVEHQFTVVYPKAKQVREDLMDIIERQAPKGSDPRIKYESTLASLANYAKNFGGMIESYQRSDLLTRKEELEKELAVWLAGDADRNQQYGDSLKQLDKLVAKEQETYLRDMIFYYMYYAAAPRTAERLYRLALEKQKPDNEREPGYMERDMVRFEESLKRMSRRYSPEVDQAILAYLLEQYSALPKSSRLPSLDRVFGLTAGFDRDALSAKLSSMYATTELGDESIRLKWMDASVADFQSSNDPMIRYAVVSYDERMALELADKELTGNFQQWRPRYMEALIAYYKGLNRAIYADANSTLRVTYGNVKGYSPKDGMMYTPFTRLEGITQKDTGEWPFNAPKKQLELIADKQYGPYKLESLGSVPVNYLSTVDTTGGNSGSATLNGNAELVGLLFDGTLDSIIGDWDFNDDLNRSIHVDTRYMLWVMKYLDGADNLLQEMEIVE